MARPVVILVLVLLACVPSVAALSADDALSDVAGLTAYDAGGCVHTEDESDEGPVKVGQEEPGVFVGIPGGSSEDAAADGDADAGAKDLPGLDGPFSGVGVFIRNRDCELPALDDLQSLAAQAL